MARHFGSDDHSLAVYKIKRIWIIGSVLASASLDPRSYEV